MVSASTQNPTAAVAPANRNPITYPQPIAAASDSAHLTVLADRRAASGTAAAIGIVANRRSMPCTASVAARNAAEIAVKATACSAISGIRNCP